MDMKIKPFEKKLYLSSPTMHGQELEYMKQAYETNWMSTVGENINEVEREICSLVGCKHAVGLSCGTSALHLAVKLAGVKAGDKVFCSDMTFAATVNPVVYEKAEPVFIDTEAETWNMDPDSLEKAFELFPQTKAVVVAHLYGMPAKIDKIKEICSRHEAVLIEDAAESLGATFCAKQTGTFGDVSAISFNGNKIITGSAGGMLLTNSDSLAFEAKKLSTQARENAPWYQHEQIGYNYRMSNVIAGVVRGQIPHLYEHIEQKKEIYLRYKEGFKDLPVSMNPCGDDKTTSNYWLSCMIIEKDAMCAQTRTDLEASFVPEKGKSCPTQILQKLAEYNAEGRPIWKPMHMQPIFAKNAFVKTANQSVGEDIFERGLCLPSDNKMTKEQQQTVIEIIRRCFE